MGNASSAVLACHHVLGHHRDRGIADLHHVSDAGHAPDRGGLEALHLATEYRAVLDRGIEHPGQFHVEPIDLGAGQLVQRVEALHRLPDELPVLRVLERHVGRRGELRRGCRHLAVRGRAAGAPVRDHAVGGTALGGRHPPGVGGGLDQHRARRGAALADVLVRGADAAAAARGEIAPHALAFDALPGGRILGGHLRPVALQLLGHQLGETGERSLPHLGARDPDHDRVVRADDHPGGDLGRAVLRADDPTAKRDVQAQREPAADRGGADDEGAPADLQSVGDHGIYSLCLGRSVDGLTHLLERAAAADVGDRRIDIGVGRLSACPSGAPPPP